LSNETITGGLGNDSISGGTGNDKLVSDAGADTLSGGLGSDSFVFTGVSTDDKITDFNKGDKIDLSVIDASVTATGNNAFTFIGSSAFSTTNATGQLRFDSNTHTLYGSNDADSTAEFSVQLTGVNSLATTDLVA